MFDTSNSIVVLFLHWKH